MSRPPEDVRGPEDAEGEHVTGVFDGTGRADGDGGDAAGAEAGRVGPDVERFTRAERWVHRATAVLMLTLIATGMVLPTTFSKISAFPPSAAAGCLSTASGACGAGDLQTRSATAAISSTGSTGTPTRASSPWRSR